MQLCLFASSVKPRNHCLLMRMDSYIQTFENLKQNTWNSVNLNPHGEFLLLLLKNQTSGFASHTAQLQSVYRCQQLFPNYLDRFPIFQAAT